MEDDHNNRRYRRNTTHQQDVFPQTKVNMRKAPKPRSELDSNVIRFRFIEKPFRYYHSMSYHAQAFIKTAFMSFVLIWPSYNLVYYFASLKARSEVHGKMEPGMTSDAIRKQILDYKQREKEGIVEKYEGSQAQAELGGEGLTDNLGVFKKDKVPASYEEFRVSPSFNRNRRTGI